MLIEGLKFYKSKKVLKNESIFKSYKNVMFIKINLKETSSNAVNVNKIYEHYLLN